MNRFLLPILLLSTSLTAMPVTWAQDEAEEDQPATTATTEKPSTDPAPRDESPFDYQSSEKISEDLSVSFPVDI